MTAAKKRAYWSAGPDYGGIALDSRGIPVMKPNGKTRWNLMRPYRPGVGFDRRFYCQKAFSSFEELELWASANGVDELVDITSPCMEEISWLAAAEEAYGRSA